MHQACKHELLAGLHDGRELHALAGFLCLPEQESKCPDSATLTRKDISQALRARMMSHHVGVL